MHILQQLSILGHKLKIRIVTISPRRSGYIDKPKKKNLCKKGESKLLVKYRLILISHIYQANIFPLPYDNLTVKLTDCTVDWAQRFVKISNHTTEVSYISISHSIIIAPVFSRSFRLSGNQVLGCISILCKINKQRV